MTSILIKNIALKTKLDKSGYSIVPKFLDAIQIEELQSFFDSTIQESNVTAPFFTTHWSNQNEYRHKINDFVTTKLTSNLLKHFSNLKCILGYYLLKKSSSHGEVYMHRDWTLIDESEYTGYILWIPLIDTNIQNGCFQVVEGSHLNTVPPRGTNIPQHNPDVKDSDFKSVPVFAGDAIIFDQRLLHSSPPNFSDKDRLAVGLIIVPHSANIVHYFYDEVLDITKKHEVGDDFLIRTYYDFQAKAPKNYILDIISSY